MTTDATTRATATAGENRPANETLPLKAGAGAAKKPYRKPQLKKLGLLKSVAGSGIAW